MLEFIPGPVFLLLYLALLVLAFVGSRLVHRQLSRPPATDGLPADPYEQAYLVGGPRRAVLAALTALSQTGHLPLGNGTPTTFLYRGNIPAEPPFLKAVAEAVPGVATTDMAQLLKNVARPLEEVKQSLVQRGWLSSTGHRLMSQLATLALFGALETLGVLRIAFAPGNRPVGYLMLLLWVGLFAGLAAMLLIPYRTPAGEAELKLWKERNTGLEATAAAGFNRLSATDAALAVALFGGGILASTALESLAVYATTSSSGCGSGCGSSCGGGGGCGGGCGGGGCGG